MTIGLKIDISFKIVLNLTDVSWTDLQKEIQYFLNETTLHCLTNERFFHLADVCGMDNGICKNYPDIQMFWRFPKRKLLECIFIQRKEGEEPIEFSFTDSKHMGKF